MDHEERLKAALADRYRIEREIGSGGMASVYLAQDLRHERKVALKVLRSDLAASLGAERFLQEVRVTANLQHPHILPLFDSGEADGFLFYVMPYIEGESLRERLAREHELPVPEAARLLRDVVDALAAAHKLGVVHRDIKPENVLISGRHAMVADFGVAKAVSEATGRHKLTTLGVALGTPSYMAPEQAAADETIDQRADLYAVGAMAYELLTGRPPFTGSTPQQILAAQVMETPQPVTELRASVPPALETLIMRCLEKKPADRWQSAEEMLPHLEAAATPSGGMTPTDMQPVTLASSPQRRRRWAWVAGVGVLAVFAMAYLLLSRQGDEAGPVTEEHRVAVLPLDNRTGDASLDGLSLTAADWITEGLVRTELFRVVPFDQVMGSNDALSASADPSTTLASAWPAETGATLAVVGSFSVLGDSVQFRLRLVDRDGTALDTVDPVAGSRMNPSEALGRLQTRVMAAVARVLAPANEMAWSDIGRDPPNPQAHEAFLEAVRSIGGSTNLQALDHLHRALELDPEFLSPLLWMTPVLWNLGRYAEADSICQVSRERENEFTRQQRLSWQMECSQKPVSELSAAKGLGEFLPGMEYRIAMHAVTANRPRDALEACSRYDPTLSPMIRRWSPVGYCLTALHMLGDYEGQLAFIEEWESRRPGDHRSHQTDALIALGRHEEADRIIEERIMELDFGESPYSILNRAALEYDAHGEPEKARELWIQYLQWLETQDPRAVDTPTRRRRKAETLLFLGRQDEALDLATALAQENPGSIADLGRLGVVQATLGDRTEAEGVSARLVSMVQPFRLGENTAWRASIAAALGELDPAVRLLDQAIDEGWNVGLSPHRSPFLKPLRGYASYERLVAPKG